MMAFWWLIDAAEKKSHNNIKRKVQTQLDDEIARDDNFNATLNWAPRPLSESGVTFHQVAEPQPKKPRRRIGVFTLAEQVAEWKKQHLETP